MDKDPSLRCKGDTQCGVDLHCFQTNEDGNRNAAYHLVTEAKDGDIVFHFSTRDGAFVGASVVDGLFN